MKKFYLLFIVSVISVNLLGQDVSQIEREALMVFYNATNGPNWIDNTNWGTTEPVSTWYGIYVSEGSVIQIYLPNNQLVGFLPPEIGNLSSLSALELSGNQLNGSIPSEIGNLSSLLYLNLSSNQLNGSVPLEIKNLSSLWFLYLSENLLSGEIPSEIWDLTSLKILDLGGNQFTGHIPPEIGNLSELTFLSLGTNQLSGSIPPEIGNLTSLTNLSINEAQFTGSIPPEIGNLTSLRSLRLNRNQLTGEIPKEIGNLNSLEALLLNHNQLTGSIPSEMGNLTSLISLWLHNNQLTGSIPVEIGNLNSLEVLLLDYNQLDGSIPSQMWNLTNLAGLSLSNNQLIGAISPEIGNLTNLSSLNLSENQLQGSIPPEIGNLTNLNVLNLSWNQLQDSIPPELGSLINLSGIDLSNNNLTGFIPSEIGNLVNSFNIFLHNNELSGSLPDLSNLTSLYFLSLENNFFTFEAIEPGVSYPISSFTYNPQYNFQLNSNEIYATGGSTVSIDVSALSIHNLGGSNNQYEWFKEGVSIAPPEPDPVLVIQTVGDDDFGSYICQVTNVSVPDMILSSEEINLIRSENSSPIVVRPVSDKILSSGFVSITGKLGNVFVDPDGDILNYTAVSSNESVAVTSISEDIITITEVGLGTTKIKLTADDGHGGSVNDEFNLTIEFISSARQKATIGSSVNKSSNDLFEINSASLNSVINIYPNPSKGAFFIEKMYSDIDNILIKVINETGEIILERKFDDLKTSIDVSNYGKGLYFIQLKGLTENITRKVIIE